MIYKYLRIFNWISTIFGVGKPSNKSNGFQLISKLWSLVIAILIVGGFYFTTENNFEFSIRSNLEQISIINDVAVNVIIILINVLNGDKICIDIYEVVSKTMIELKVTDQNFRMMVIKIFIRLAIPIVSFIILVIIEIIETKPPFVLLTRIPTFLIILHLMINFYFLLAELKMINEMLSEMLLFENKIPMVNSIDNNEMKVMKYLFNHDVRFIKLDYHIGQENVQFLCKVYDNLVTCVHLLEKYHGIQVLLIIWLMFSSAVFGVTLISCKQAKYPWLVIASSILPFFWCSVGCYIEDQLQTEVEQTETLIVKYMIDYRSDQIRKNSLQTFKQLLSINRLQFSACNLFHLNYSMLLGTVMNIITYSIILIQLFLNE